MSFGLSFMPDRTTVSDMQDRDVVAAVVAGERDGIAEVYDRYAASLYAYCHSMLPKPEAAEVVQDTFLIAVSRLDGLRDPDRLDAWLHAVARNECLRRLGPASVATARGAGFPLSGSGRTAGGHASDRTPRAGTDGLHRQLADRARAPGQRDASRGRVRPVGVPQGDRPGLAPVVAAGPAASWPDRGRGRDGGGGGGGWDHRDHDGRRIAAHAGLRPRAGRRSIRRAV